MFIIKYKIQRLACYTFNPRGLSPSQTSAVFLVQDALSDLFKSTELSAWTLASVGRYSAMSTAPSRRGQGVEGKISKGEGLKDFQPLNTIETWDIQVLIGSNVAC